MERVFRSLKTEWTSTRRSYDRQRTAKSGRSSRAYVQPIVVMIEPETERHRSQWGKKIVTTVSPPTLRAERRLRSRTRSFYTTHAYPDHPDQQQKHTQAEPRHHVIEFIADQCRKQTEKAQQSQQQRPTKYHPETAPHALPSVARPLAFSSARRFSNGTLRRPHQRYRPLPNTTMEIRSSSAQMTFNGKPP